MRETQTDFYSIRSRMNFQNVQKFQMITLQVGQCGNQVGTSLYDTIASEIVETKDSEEEVLMARRTFFRESKEKLVSRSVLVDVRICFIRIISLIDSKLHSHFQSLVTHLFIHTLTQATMHTHVTDRTQSHRRGDQSKTQELVLRKGYVCL